MSVSLKTCGGRVAAVVALAGAACSGPVPAAHQPVQRTHARFEASAVSAVSAQRLWLLGPHRCLTSACRAVGYRSTDGGRSWIRMQLPAVAYRPDPLEASHGVSGLAFADARHGWLFGPDLWATDDAGRSWRRIRVPGQVEQLALGRRYAWLLAGDCTPGHGCDSHVLMRSPLRRSQFSPVRLPRPMHGDGATPDLAVDGDRVAVLRTRDPAPAADHAQVEVSSDAGDRWVVHRIPCLNELGGQLSVADSALWALCPTGSLAGLHLLTRGRLTPVVVFGGPMPSFSTVTAVTGSTAFLVVLGDRVYRTGDAGRRWHSVRLPAGASRGVAMTFSFPDPEHGYAVSLGSASSTLLRTDDRGHSWRVIPIS